MLFCRLRSADVEHINFVDLYYVPHTSLLKRMVQSGVSTVAGRVSEQRDVVSVLILLEIRNFLCRGLLASGDLPSKQMDKLKMIPWTGY